MSKMLYTRFTKIIIDYILSHNKNIPRKSDSKLHISQNDQPITKLLITTNGDDKFEMEVPEAMISDAIKKKGGYTYYMAKKVESKIANSISIQEPHTQQRRRSQLTIHNQLDDTVADTYDKWGQKLKGLTVDDPAVQSLLDLRKRSKSSRLDSLKQKKQVIVGEQLNVLSYHISSTKLTPRQSKEADAKGEKTMRKIKLQEEHTSS
ncbi:hypothetical protein Tco_0678270 [Tanacetum coccineum]|uniref:Uncharacterized protein n=1 Tax=Tanacetum coccineum TaxID=301880 RepID=A0ABQ4XFX1_9ASTR